MISSEISSPSPVPPLMCKTRANTMATDPQPRPLSRLGRSSDAITSSAAGSSFPTAPASSSSQSSSSKASSAISSRASLSSLRDSLPENPTFYPFSEICSATNNFLSKRLSSSSSSWRCSLRSKDAVVFQRAFRGDRAALPARLSAVCKSHHSSLVRLLGASLGGDYIYLVYEYTAGANLEECLRNPRNPNFTTLSKWISRMQVATDLAQGLEYIHYHSAVGGVSPSVPPDHGRTRGTVHNRIKSSSIIITEPNFNAKICHFGAAELAGEIPTAADKAEEEDNRKTKDISEAPSPTMKRSDSRRLKINGTRGYMAPEVLAGGSISQRSDVFAYGVVLLELLTGQEPLKYKFDRATKDYERISLIETARDAIGTEDEDGALEAEAEERRGRIRRWVDRRLRDSYPVDVAEKLIRVGLRCVEAEPWMRPDMTWVAGKVSKLFLDSKAWGEKVRVPTDFSVSLAPR